MTSLTNDNVVEGFNHVCNAVKLTMGAAGSLALIEKQMGQVVSTKDGVETAKSVYFGDSPELTYEQRDKLKQKQLGANMAKQCSVKTLMETGDNTTTTLVVAQSLINNVIELGSKYPIPEIIRGIDEAHKDVKAEIKKLSKKVNKKSLKDIATISANGDTNISNMLLKAYEAVGRNGIIDIIKSDAPTSKLKVIKGFKTERGYVSPFMTTNSNNLTFEAEDVTVIIYENSIGTTNVGDIESVIAKIKTPIVVVAEDFSEDVVENSVYTHLNKIRQLCLIKASEFGEERKQILQDLATYTDGEVFIPAVSKEVKVGICKKVIISDSSSLFIQDELNDNSKTLLKTLESQPKNKFLEKRIANFKNGVATILVGGITDAEINEVFDRFEDAKHAIKSSIEMGFVAGGGSTFLYISNSLKAPKTLIKSESVGYETLLKALQSPFQTILSNAYVKHEDIKRQLTSYGMLYDVRNRKIVTSEESGIIDSTKSLMVALENAISTSKLIINTRIISTI